MSTESQIKTIDFCPDERNVFFHLLTKCNLSCRHCYIDQDKHGRNMLPLSTVLSWLKEFSRPELSSNLVLLGGEPTLHPDLAIIISKAKEMNYRVTVDSNGYLFHELLEKTSPNELDCLSFSLDGPSAEINDRIRGKGVFEVCRQNLLRAVKLGFHTSLIYTVSALNIDHLYLMPDLLKKWGVERFFIQVIGLRGNPAESEEPDLWQVDPDKWLQTVPQVAKKAAELGISVVWPKVYLDGDEEFSCAPLVAENYFVFPNGRVYQCPLCEDYPIHSFMMENNILKKRSGLNEDKFFPLNIPEGCVMNKLLQPGNIVYQENGQPKNRISCCLLKQKLEP